MSRSGGVDCELEAHVCGSAWFGLRPPRRLKSERAASTSSSQRLLRFATRRPAECRGPSQFVRPPSNRADALAHLFAYSVGYRQTWVSGLTKSATRMEIRVIRTRRMDRFVRSLAGLFAISALVAGGSAHADDPLGELMRRLAAHPGGHVRFVERQTLSLLKHPVESSGELVYEPPDHLEKRVLAPRPESMTIDKGVLTFERAGRRRSVALASYPELGAFIESIRATLAGDRAALEALYVVDLTTASGGWTLSLVPRAPQLAKLARLIRITGREVVVEGVEIQRPDGDRSVMAITPLVPAQ